MTSKLVLLGVLLLCIITEAQNTTQYLLSSESIVIASNETAKVTLLITNTSPNQATDGTSLTVELYTNDSLIETVLEVYTIPRGFKHIDKIITLQLDTAYNAVLSVENSITNNTQAMSITFMTTNLQLLTVNETCGSVTFSCGFAVGAIADGCHVTIVELKKNTSLLLEREQSSVDLDIERNEGSSLLSTASVSYDLFKIGTTYTAEAYGTKRGQRADSVGRSTEFKLMNANRSCQYSITSTSSSAVPVDTTQPIPFYHNNMYIIVIAGVVLIVGVSITSLCIVISVSCCIVKRRYSKVREEAVNTLTALGIHHHEEKDDDQNLYYVEITGEKMVRSTPQSIIIQLPKDQLNSSPTTTLPSSPLKQSQSQSPSKSSPKTSSKPSPLHPSTMQPLQPLSKSQLKSSPSEPLKLSCLSATNNANLSISHESFVHAQKNDELIYENVGLTEILKQRHNGRSITEPARNPLRQNLSNTYTAIGKGVPKPRPYSVHIVPQDTSDHGPIDDNGLTQHTGDRGPINDNGLTQYTSSRGPIDGDGLAQYTGDRGPIEGNGLTHQPSSIDGSEQLYVDVSTDEITLQWNDSYNTFKY
jgi:hypothetical protein